MSTITPPDKTPPPTMPQPAAPAQTPARNDHDADDAPGAVRPTVDKGVGESFDKSV